MKCYYVNDKSRFSSPKQTTPEIITWGYSKRIITPPHKAHTSFLKPSQLPGEYTAQLLPLQRI